MGRAVASVRWRWWALAVALLILLVGGLLQAGDEPAPFEGEERLQVVARMALPAGPWRIAARGPLVVLVSRHPDRLIGVDLDAGGGIRLGRPVELPGPPHDVTIDGDTVWVSVARKGVFAYRDGRRTRSVRLRRGSYRVAAAGGWIWSVDDYGDRPEIVRIDPRASRVRERVPLKIFVEDLTEAPDGTVLALGNGKLQRVGAGRPASAVVDTGEHGVSVGEVAGGRLWFSGIDAAVGRSLGAVASTRRVALPDAPEDVAAGPRGAAAVSLAGTVSVIGPDGTMRATARVGPLSRSSVAIDVDGTVWATGYDERTLVALRIAPGH